MYTTAPPPRGAPGRAEVPPAGGLRSKHPVSPKFRRPLRTCSLLFGKRFFSLAFPSPSRLREKPSPIPPRRAFPLQKVTWNVPEVVRDHLGASV